MRGHENARKIFSTTTKLTQYLGGGGGKAAL